MTRREAVCLLYQVINSGILDADIESSLSDVAECICEDGFEECEDCDKSDYYECKYLK